MRYWTEDRLRFKRLIEVLSGRAGGEAEAEMGAPFDPRLADAMVDVMAGEERLGLDTLCSNVFDYNVRLTPEEYATIVDLAGRWELDTDALDALDPDAPLGVDRSGLP